ncbi:hypothetical protein WJX77_012437 [Trebouxia sp. C0004]
MWRIPGLQESSSPRKTTRTCSEGCSVDAPLAARFRRQAPSDYQQGCYLAAMPIAEKIPSSPDQDGSSMEQWGRCMKGMPAARAVPQRPPVIHLPTCPLKMVIGSSGLGSTTAAQTAQTAQTLHTWMSSITDSGCQLQIVAESTRPLLPQSSSVPSGEGVWSPPDAPSLCKSSLTVPLPSSPDSEALQEVVSEPMLETTINFLPASPFDTMDMSEDSNMWAADCLPDDVDKLLDWAADSAAASTFSDPSLDSAQLSMSCYELPQQSFELQFEAQGVQIQTSRQPSSNLDKPSTGYDTHTLTTAMQECPVSMVLPRDLCSDGLPHPASPQPASQQAKVLLVPDVNCEQSPWTLGQASMPLLYDSLASDALQHQQLASDAPQHQQLAADAPQLPSDALQQQQLASDEPQHQQLASDALQHQQLASHAHQHQLLTSDPLGLLMQREQDLCFGALPSLSGTDSSPSSGSDEQVGVPDVKGGCQMKRRCGRPRVYDLDRLGPSDAARAALKSPQKTKGRGAKPKYIYNTAEEAIAKRRKRNRDTATQSYYNRKQRVSMLTNEMAGLKEENAALRTILCILERDPQADKGWLRQQLSAGRSSSSILPELQQTSSWMM